MVEYTGLGNGKKQIKILKDLSVTYDMVTSRWLCEKLKLC